MTTVTNILTLNQLVNNLQDIADKHYQINDFKYGDPWEFYSSGVTRAPEMWVTCESVTREGDSVSNFNMKIYIVDNVKTGELNELEVESDTIQIAEDVLAQLRHHGYGWAVDARANVSMNVRTERSPKNLTGVDFNVNIRIRKPDDRCRIPFSTNPITT
jgi:hypothetical protein